MSERHARLFLEDILDSAEKIKDYTKSLTYDQFVDDSKTIDAVIRNLEIIGEAANRLPEDIKDKTPETDWHKIRGLRNRIVHGYFGINYKIIWNVIEDYLPILIIQISELIEQDLNFKHLKFTMQPLYPLTFKNIYKDKIWGGKKINTYLHKDFGSLPNCGETWEISGVKSDVSVVANGALEGESLADLLEKYQDQLVGKKVYDHFGNIFPLLIKFIDANEDLSIQVHPDDELAKKRHNSFGKTEMWYVIEADPGSTLIAGFNKELTEQEYLDKFNSGHLTDILNKEDVKAGDVFFLPAGRVHTIGKGLLIAEIQQTSDITYRIYDFDRLDDKGNKRELHVEEALAAIDYKHYPEYKTSYQPEKNKAIELVTCPYFTTNLLDYTKSTEKDYSNLDSFVIYVCIEGEFAVTYNGGSYPVKMGDCILLPRSIDEVQLETETGFKILESYIGG